jgi:hypothetical protein
MAKYTIDFGPNSEKTLDYLARIQKTSKEEVIRRSVAFFAEANEEIERGNTVAFLPSSSKTSELLAA